MPKITLLMTVWAQVQSVPSQGLRTTCLPVQIFLDTIGCCCVSLQETAQASWAERWVLLWRFGIENMTNCWRLYRSILKYTAKCFWIKDWLYVILILFILIFMLFDLLKTYVGRNTLKSSRRKKKANWDFPGSLVVKTLLLPMQRVRIWFLIRQLRSYMLLCYKKERKKERKNHPGH